MAVTNSYSRERKYHCRLLVVITKWKPWMEVILNDLKKNIKNPRNSFYFKNTLLIFLHLLLIKRFPNMSYGNAKIQRLLILSLLSEKLQSFMKFPPFKSLEEIIYKIKIIPWWVTQLSCPVMVPLLKDFSWYYSHPILCHLVTVYPSHLL